MQANLFLQQAERPLTWANEPPGWSYTDDGALLADAPAGADYYQDPAGKHIVSSAPFLHARAGTHFELTTRLAAKMKDKYDSGCLMVWADDRNWAKLCFEFNGRFPAIVSVVTKDGSSDDCNSERVEVEQPYLRVMRAGNCLSFFYSADGDDWELVRYFGMALPDECRVGVVAQSPQGNGCAVRFDYLALEESQLTELP